MAAGSLQCASAGQVFLLLKASDFIHYDLERTMQPVLVLKKWMDIDPSKEFRCFVVQGHAVAACQRDLGQFYPYLKSESTRMRMWDRISAFVNNEVIPNFNSQGGDYCVDLYVADDKIWLVDLGPIPEDMSELVSLESLSRVATQVIAVLHPNSVDRSHERALAMHKVPLEIVTGDLTDFQHLQEVISRATNNDS